MRAACKPLPHRPAETEQNSRFKNIFPLRSLTSHDSLSELRNQRIDTDILPSSIYKTTRKHQPLMCKPVEGWIVCHHASKQLIWPKAGTSNRTGPQGNYLRPSVTWMVSVIQFNTQNTTGLPNVIWQLYEQR